MVAADGGASRRDGKALPRRRNAVGRSVGGRLHSRRQELVRDELTAFPRISTWQPATLPSNSNFAHAPEEQHDADICLQPRPPQCHDLWPPCPGAHYMTCHCIRSGSKFPNTSLIADQREPPVVSFAKKEVLALTHEGASAQEMEPYLGWRMRPARPLLMYGRSYSSDPTCGKQESVWWFWKDSMS